MSLLPPKAGQKTRLSQNHLPKTYQLLLGTQGSNQTKRIKSRSRENHQSRVEVGQTRNWNSVFQSAGCNPNATNRTCFETKINRNKKAGTENACRPNSSTGVLRANIKQWTIVQKKHWCWTNKCGWINKTTMNTSNDYIARTEPSPCSDSGTALPNAPHY